MKRPTSHSSEIEQAVRLLAEEARRRIERHPSGHLLRSGKEALDLSLQLDPSPHNSEDGRAAEALDRDLDAAIEGLIVHRAAFRPGRVFCLRCATPDCEHAVPPSSREVFAGYGATGIPRFLDFGQLLLERGDPRVDRLYARPPALLAHTLRRGHLTAELLEPYRNPESGFRIHGQVAAGWYGVPDPTGRPQAVALSFQIVSTRPGKRGRRRFGLNVLGIGPDGQPLEQLYDRLRELPWQDTVRWAQTALDQITFQRKKPGKRSKSEEPLERRLLQVLNGLARRLEKHRRAKDRKTLHGQQRARQTERPTHMALADLAKAGKDELLYDTRQETLVVLGARGRAHVFNPAGKLVTSIRYTPAAIEKRRHRKLWRRATAEEIQGLRQKVAG
ncbi:MAG: hypothetical protein AAF481_16740 [Acidobacteriota bacterium]